MVDSLSTNTTDSSGALDIAIVGMTGRFPGAANVEQYWRNLRDGVESISVLSEEELLASGVSVETRKDPRYVRSRGMVDGVDLFDAEFFRFSPREAAIVDPQQRIFLECAWDALEQAGYDPDRYPGLIGVYAGSGWNTYLLNLLGNREFRDNVHSLDVMVGSDKDFLSTRVSYKLNLRGPSISIQTACSSSLVAVHIACQSLLTYQCDMALAGGVSVQLPQKQGYLYQEGSILSPDGHCRAFDLRAAGTVFSGGAGVVVLKRLADAIADGDIIYAVIKGSAINNDGSLKAGYTAPSIDGQADAIARAQELAGVDPETINYIEAHGTGTIVGDPIEVTALTQVFRRKTDAKGFCAIGSVKANIGHLDIAAGVAGLIKTTLALQHGQLPPSLNFEEANPAIDFANSPFYVNTKLSEWKTNRHPRRAGVSSFGIGGTNAHVVLQEMPPQEDSGPSRPWQMLLLSARTETALDAMTGNLVKHLRDNSGLNLADAAHTLQVGRKIFSHRLMVVCRDAEDAVKVLETREPQRVFSVVQERRDRAVAFMFTGQGAQYQRMASDIYANESTFRAEMDACAELLKPDLGLDLREVLYPKDSNPADQEQRAATSLDQTWLTQPALFAIEYALAKLWMAWGVKPQAMIGHSIGEYVAACLAGVFSLEDALALVAARGRLMQELPGGAMLSVALAEEQLRPLLGADLSLAAVNGPGLCVVAGPHVAVESLHRRLQEQKVACQELHTSHAFHSVMMEPILEAFSRLVQKIKPRAPKLPYISNVTGTWITASEAIDASYWARHLRQSVRFGDGIHELLKDPNLVLLEVGPGQTLTALARRNLEKDNERAVFPSLRQPKSPKADLEFVLETLGRLWLAGVSIDWKGFYSHERRCRVPLPTYPFERKRYWIEPDSQGEINSKAQPERGKRSDIDSWLYFPSWKRADLPSVDFVSERQSVLIMGHESDVGKGLAERFEHAGQRVIRVSDGVRFAKVDDHSYTIRCSERLDYDQLFRTLYESNNFPVIIVHLWNVGASNTVRAEFDDDAAGFRCLLPFAQSLGLQQMTIPLRVAVVSTHVHEVTGEEKISPGRATLLGACRVIPQEFPGIGCQNIDIVPPQSSVETDRAVERLMLELLARTKDVVIAYRGNHRWVQTYEAVRVAEPTGAKSQLRENGIYLITGGLDRIGLMCAEYLARKVKARLILVGQLAFPAREEWEGWLTMHGPQDEISLKIERLKTIEARGAKVMVVSADVASEEQMNEVVRHANARFGLLNGVIHSATGIGDELSSQDLLEIGSSDIELHFRPKGRGLRVLETVLQQQQIDFLLLESSLSVVLGGIGMAAYAAANAYMDAFTQRHNQTSTVPWIAVNWDHCEFASQPGEKAARANTYEFSLTPEEGEAVLERVLSADAPREVVVSTGDIQARLSQWVEREWHQQGFVKIDTTKTHQRPASLNDYVAPRDSVERHLVEIWETLIGVTPIGLHDKFFDLGGDSLLAVQLVHQIEKVFGKKLPVKALFQAPTIDQLAEALRAEDSSRDWISLEPLQPNGSKPPFFFLAGRSHFGDRLGPDQPVYRVVYQDLDREQPFVRIEDMAAHAIKSVRRNQSDGPYYLGGHGLGGTVAFEMAQQLQQQGEKVALLALCECWTQESRRPTRGISSAYRLWQRVHYHFHRTQRIGPKQELTKLRGSLRNKIQEVVWRNQSSPLTRSQKGHRAAVYEALRRYVTQTYSGRITVLRCAERVPWQEYDPLYGWGNIARDGVEAYEIPGSHAGIYKEPNVGTLAETLRDVLQKAQAKTAGESLVLVDADISAARHTSAFVGNLKEIGLKAGTSL